MPNFVFSYRNPNGLWWEGRTASPMLSLSMFRTPSFSSANAVSFFMYAGLRLLAWTAAPVVVAPIAGQLADRYGNRPFIAAGLLFQAVGLGWVTAIAAAHVG